MKELTWSQWLVWVLQREWRHCTVWRGRGDRPCLGKCSRWTLKQDGITYWPMLMP